MKTMGKETRRMLCWLLAIFLAAAAGLTALLSYMTSDFQKTMVEHDYGTAGYLVNHPDTNVASAFTKGKTDSDMEAGRQILKEAGYHENTDPRMVPAVAAYQKRTAVMLHGMLFSVFAVVFFDSLDLHPETKEGTCKGGYRDHTVPFRGYGTEDRQ